MPVSSLEAHDCTPSLRLIWRLRSIEQLGFELPRLETGFDRCLVLARLQDQSSQPQIQASKKWRPSSIYVTREMVPPAPPCPSQY